MNEEAQGEVMLANGTYVRMVSGYGSPKISGTVETVTNHLGKPQMLLSIDPRLNWKPSQFFVYVGTVEPCAAPSDAEIERINQLLAAFDRA